MIQTTHKTPYMRPLIQGYIYIYIYIYVITMKFVLLLVSNSRETSNKYQLFKEEWHYKIILLLILHEIHLTNLSDPIVVGKKVWNEIQHLIDTKGNSKSYLSSNLDQAIGTQWTC